MAKKEFTKSEISAQVIPTLRQDRKAVKVGIIGGAGYTGGELIRLLIHHPDTAVSFIHSRSNADKPVYTVHQDLFGDTELKFTGNLSDDIDVLFLCLGHGESKNFFLKIRLQIK